MELNININQKRLIEFCKNHELTVTGFTPLGSLVKSPSTGDADIPNFLENPKVIELAKKYGKTPAQVALRFVVRI